MKKYKKLFIFLGSICGLSLLSYYFKSDLVRWSCHEENNPASCFIMGEELLHDSKPELAKSYYQRSCTGKYKKACARLKTLR
jgi:hypothetical protein